MRKKPVLDIETVKDMLASWRENPQDFFPADYGKQLPEKGAWIMLLTSVDVGNQLPDNRVQSIHVPHLSIWYALPTTAGFTREVGGHDLPLHLAILQTPQGEVRVWPHEYVLVQDLGKYLEFGKEDGFYIHFMSPETQGFNPDKLFYLRSRGLSQAQAQRFLLPELHDPYFCYFTLHSTYSEYFPEGTGIPHLRPRRIDEHSILSG